MRMRMRNGKRRETELREVERAKHERNRTRERE